MDIRYTYLFKIIFLQIYYLMSPLLGSTVCICGDGALPKPRKESQGEGEKAINPLSKNGCAYPSLSWADTDKRRWICKKHKHTLPA